MKKSRRSIVRGKKLAEWTAGSIAYLAILVTVSVSLVSSPTEAKVHRHHEAHSHGGGHLELAFDGSKGKIQFQAAAMGVLGFEHLAKSEADLKILEARTNEFRIAINQWIQFSSDLNCVLSASKIEQTPDSKIDSTDSEGPKKHPKHTKASKVSRVNRDEVAGAHSNFIANYDVTCDRPVIGSKIRFDFSKLKGIRDLDITVVADDLQRVAEFKGQPIAIDLLPSK